MKAVYPERPTKVIQSKLELTLIDDAAEASKQNQQTNTEVFCVRFNKKGDYVMSGHADRTVRLWNASKGTKVSSFDGAHNREIFDIAIFEDNEKFVTCGGDKVVYLWEVLKGHWTRKFDGHTQQVNCVALSPVNNVLASGSFDSTVKLWDLLSRNFRPIQTMDDFKDSVTAIKVTETQIIAASVDGFLRVYDMRMGKLLAIDLGVAINSFDLSLDPKFAACSCLDSTTRIVDLFDGQVIAEYTGGHQSIQYHGSVRFSANNKYLAQASECGKVALYDVSSKRLSHSLVGHQSPVISLDVSNNLIASGSADSTVKIWSVSD